MKKPNKRVEANRQRIAQKKARQKAGRKQVRLEHIAARNNVVEAKKQELFDKWVAAVGSMQEEQSKG